MTLIINEFTKPGIKKPIWLMRQAGRYLPEYKEVRKNFKNFLEFCYNVEAVKTVTKQPLERFNFDAAIIFSDILVIPDALGQKVSFQEKIGPILGKISKNITSKELDYRKLNQVYTSINELSKELGKNKALFGFCGAPFTLSCYMFEGKTSKNFENIKQLIYTKDKFYIDVINKLTFECATHLINQIKNGCNIVQIFDSWAGILHGEFYEEYIIEPTKKIVKIVKESFPNVPIIGFPRNSGNNYINYAKNTGVDGISIDQNICIKWANENLPSNILLQGNLDPSLLSCENEYLEKEILNILNTVKNRKFIFNLGHGILPSALPSNVSKLVNTVKNYE
ncbi:MAG: uroporphyrinogen decarboxylase [Sphingobacteriia bacterium]|nr:uroporphyrinogen decarboxylase [Sphingobacteriia bacterium]